MMLVIGRVWQCFSRFCSMEKITGACVFPFIYQQEADVRVRWVLYVLFVGSVCRLMQ